MNNNKQEEGIDIRQLLFTFISKWYLYVIALVICMSIAILKVYTSPNIYEVYSILKWNIGSTKSEEIFDAADLDKRLVNLEDKIIEIKSTNYVTETLENLDFSVSYFTKGKLTTEERYKLDFPIKVVIDSSINLITGKDIFIRVLNNEEFELEYQIEDQPVVTLYNFSKEIEIQQQYPNQKYIKKFLFDKPISEEDLGLGFTISLIGDPKKFGDDELFFRINNPVGMTKAYLDKLNLEIAGRESSILYLKMGSAIIQKQTAFLNALMEVIIQKNLEEKNQEALKTIDFIDFQLADVSSSLNKAESDLESIGYATTSIGESSVLYRERNDLESQVASYNVQLQNLRNILSNLENITASAISTGSLEFDDPMIDNLMIKLTDLYQQKANLRRTATEVNPIIQRVNLEIQTTKEALRNALNGAINNTNVVIENLNNRLRQTNATINKLPSAERRKLGIQRKFEFSDNTYDLFMQRKATAGIALATSESDWKIIENAKINTYLGLISPNKKFIYLLAIFLSLVVPSVIILVLDALDNRIKSKKDIEKITDIPVLGTIVKGHKNKKIITQYGSKSALTESIRELRINLQFLSSNQHNVIGITSSVSGEGKTFCAVNLGAVIAQSGKKVLVLDADLRNSSMNSYFNVPRVKHGLSSYLIGTSKIENIINTTEIKNMHVIFAGPIPPNPADLLGLPNMPQLIQELRKNYDYLILDFPPVGIVGDYLILSRYLDINIYISKYKFTLKKSFEKINSLFANNKLSNLSIVLNEAKADTIYGANPYYIREKK